MVTAQLCFGLETNSGETSISVYEKWETAARGAASEALDLLKKAGVSPQKGNLIVLTNAGYAEVNGSSTQGALDGLAFVTAASRGRNTLVEIHSASWTPLWFALYDKVSGYCAYLEVDSSAAAKTTGGSASASSDPFGIRSVERINVEHLYAHPSEFKVKFDKKIFGGNEFRIVTIANAIAKGAPAYAIRAFEFHDHYCPGVTSGILMTNYLKKHFPPGDGGYFIHAVEPWCKEDAFLVLLNATPGKGGYAVSYPADADKTCIVPEAKNASTIVYRRKEKKKKWEGLVLAFAWAEPQCPTTGNAVIDKLCTDLWYLERMEKPEDFVKVVKSFELPEGVSPRDWARPGVDPLKMLGLIKK
jgi:formylmethanofuran dehydrogenase subunit E-like metal-binding protein